MVVRHRQGLSVVARVVVEAGGLQQQTLHPEVELVKVNHHSQVVLEVVVQN